MTQLSIIAAMASNNVIGLNNTLPWHLPEDLKRFKALTTGHHMIMGRKTYESLGRLLPNRTTVIVTRNKDYQVEGALIAHSVEEAIQMSSGDDEAFLIGGAELYKEGVRLADKLYLTYLKNAYDGDTKFPIIDFNQWTEQSKKDLVSINGLEYNNFIYVRSHENKPQYE